MSTRSLIGYFKDKKTYRYVYCQHDGYLRHNGDILLRNYTTIDEVKHLVEGGDMSTLAISPQLTSYYNDSESGVREIIHFDFLEIELNSGIEYIYFFIQNKGWFYTKNMKEFFPLTQEEIDKEQKI